VSPRIYTTNVTPDVAFINRFRGRAPRRSAVALAGYEQAPQLEGSAALKARSFVVTGDRALLALDGIEGVGIITPRAFLDLLDR
jgi:hypothetical protein